MSNGFPMVPLGEVLIQYQEYIENPEPKEYPKLSVKLYGNGVVLDTPADGATLKMKRHQIARSGQVILSEIWGKKGAIGFVPPEGDGALCTSHFFLFDVIHDKLDSNYLQAIFTANYLQTQLDADAKGTTGYAAVRPKNLLSACIPLPPLEEQRRIVARIEELAAKIEEARGLRRETVEELRGLTPSVVAQTLLDCLDSAKVVTVADVAKSVTDGDHLPPPKSDSGEIPFIFISNIVEGKLNLSNCKWVSQQYFNSLAPSRVAKKGDVLYTAVGSYGIPCSVDIDEPFCFQRHIAIIKPDHNLILSKYMIWALSSSDVFDQATKAATGSAQLTVPLRDIRKLRFLLPSLPEQRRIVAYLDDLQARVDAVRQLQAETRAELDGLLPSILDKAFRGELV
jgi:type I restriction enzyme S subunit